jgi:hypothetical protein
VVSTGWQAVKMRTQKIISDVVIEKRYRADRGFKTVDRLLRADLVMLADRSVPCAHRSMARFLAAAISQAPGRSGMPDPGQPSGLRQTHPGELLGKPDVAHKAGEAGDQLRLLDPPDGLDGAVDVGSRHGCRSNHLVPQRARRRRSQ